MELLDIISLDSSSFDPVKSYASKVVKGENGFLSTVVEVNLLRSPQLLRDRDATQTDRVSGVREYNP